ncbi:MAG: cytochrome c biogenesis CcdA family protein [Anaerolineaceae bacterium]
MEQILTSLGLGILASASPCILPLYPGFLAYLSATRTNEKYSRQYLLGFFVLAGVLTMMLTMGLVISLFSISIGRGLAIIIPIANFVLIILGIFLLIDKNPFMAIPQLKVPGLKNPLSKAFVYGLLYGPIALPCSGPLVVSVFAFSLTTAEALNRLNVFLWFGLGFGLPLLILSMISGVMQRRITRWLALKSRIINIFAGILLIGIGFYNLILNWEFIRLVLGF